MATELGSFLLFLIIFIISPGQRYRTKTDKNPTRVTYVLSCNRVKLYVVKHCQGCDQDQENEDTVDKPPLLLVSVSFPCCLPPPSHSVSQLLTSISLTSSQPLQKQRDNFLLIPQRSYPVPDG